MPYAKNSPENYREDELPGYERGYMEGYLVGIKVGKRMLDAECVGDESEEEFFWRGYNTAKRRLWSPFCGGIYGGK